MFLFKLILALGIIVGVLVLVFRFQKRIKGEGGLVKGPKEERLSSTELEEFVASYRRDKGAGGTPAAPLPALQSQAPVPQAATVVPTATAPAAWKARQAFLSGGIKLGFLVLKAGLPDHHVFANTRLGELVDVPQGNAMVHLRIDLVVCNKDLAIVAAVDVPSGPEADTPPAEREKQQRLRAAGIRYFRFAPRAFPKPADVRRVIYGE